MTASGAPARKEARDKREAPLQFPSQDAGPPLAARLSPQAKPSRVVPLGVPGGAASQRDAPALVSMAVQVRDSCPVPQIVPLRPEIYQAIGRVAVAASGVEWQLASLHVVAGHAEDAESVVVQAKESLKMLRRWVRKEVEDEGLRDRAIGWLKRTGDALEQRNRVLHSLAVRTLEGAPAWMYHPRTQQPWEPIEDELGELADELGHCAGVGFNYTNLLAAATGYTPAVTP
jgi:hypothetical protein